MSLFDHVLCLSLVYLISLGASFLLGIMTDKTGLNLFWGMYDSTLYIEDGDMGTVYSYQCTTIVIAMQDVVTVYDSLPGMYTRTMCHGTHH